MMRALALVGPLLVAGCISAAPLELADDHPAKPEASSGLVGIPTTLDGYKTVTDFAARAAAEPDSPGGHAHHVGHAGMQHGAATPRSAARR
jgi:hypothetical protein